MLVEHVARLCEETVMQAFGVRVEGLALEFPEKFGDLCLNCFHLAKTLKLAPPGIAEKMARALDGRDVVAKAENVSGYVNLTLKPAALFGDVIPRTVGRPLELGRTAADERSPRVLVEFSSPNTNKPQHLGHVRNNTLGESVSRLLAAAGFHVVRANLVNDRGIHICKSMLAYMREGHGVTPQTAGKKGDHLIGDFYVLFDKRLGEELAAYKAAHPEAAKLDKEEFFKISEWGQAAQALLLRWEAGDEEVRALWRTMNAWVMDGFFATYAALGIRFDRIYFESETYVLGKEIIQRGLAAGVFYEREDGAIEIDLSAEKLDKKVVLRSDGTSVYITQDIGTTVEKAREHDLAGQVFIVGNEQIYHFKVLFAILRRLGYEWAGGLYHLAYGMVNLPEGKMKSREGTVVDADDLIDEVTALAAAEIKSRQPEVDGAELSSRARKIGLAALKFMILAVTPTTTMIYDPKASVSFEGDTGPYVLYAYARARRMIEDSGIDERDAHFDAQALGSDASETKLAVKILELPAVVRKAAKAYNPALVATYLLDLAHTYNQHVRAVPILKAEDPALRRARLLLTVAASSTLKNGLDLLGIETVDRM
jgi:arginyl-tRNA synthetase